MKYLKKFNEVRTYSEKELEDISIKDKKNYNLVIDHLKRMWNLSDEIITAVVVAMGGSYDDSEEYLSDMEAYGYDDPADYWPEWCEQNDVYHEIDNNPFI